MAWGRKKTYGSYRVESCPFCGDRAYSKNKQGLAVCAKHKNAEMGEQKCACGEYLEVKTSKWGTFFLCPSCGPQSTKRILDGPVKDKKREEHDRYADTSAKSETVVRSDDPNYFS